MVVHSFSSDNLCGIQNFHFASWGNCWGGLGYMPREVESVIGSRPTLFKQRFSPDGAVSPFLSGAPIEHAFLPRLIWFDCLCNLGIFNGIGSIESSDHSRGSDCRGILPDFNRSVPSPGYACSQLCFETSVFRIASTTASKVISERSRTSGFLHIPCIAERTSPNEGG